MVSIRFVSTGQTEQHILLTALGEDGKSLGQEFAEKLLNIPSYEVGILKVDAASANQRFSAVYDNQRATLTAEIEERNKALLDEEILHIEKWAEDQQLTLEKELNDIKAKIKE